MTKNEYEAYLATMSCKECPAYSGSDCTRDPYEEGCFDETVQKYWEEYKEKEVTVNDR